MFGISSNVPADIGHQPERSFKVYTIYRNQRYLRQELSLARVGLVYSQQTAQYYGGERAQQKVEDHT
jgi:hypothetical protein